MSWPNAFACVGMWLAVAWIIRSVLRAAVGAKP